MTAGIASAFDSDREGNRKKFTARPFQRERTLDDLLEAYVEGEREATLPR